MIFIYFSTFIYFVSSSSTLQRLASLSSRHSSRWLKPLHSTTLNPSTRLFSTNHHFNIPGIDWSLTDPSKTFIVKSQDGFQTVVTTLPNSKRNVNAGFDIHGKIRYSYIVDPMSTIETIYFYENGSLDVIEERITNNGITSFFSQQIRNGKYEQKYLYKVEKPNQILFFRPDGTLSQKREITKELDGKKRIYNVYEYDS